MATMKLPRPSEGASARQIAWANKRAAMAHPRRTIGNEGPCEVEVETVDGVTSVTHFCERPAVLVVQDRPEGCDEPYGLCEIWLCREHALPAYAKELES